MRPHGNSEALEKRRRRALRLLKAGHSYRSVATQLKSSLSSIVRWQQAYRTKGWKGLRPQPTPGRPPLIAPAQKQVLVQILVDGALKAGYATDLWTLKRVGEVTKRRFGVDYSISNLWQLMRALGWSCQMPEKRARERNERAIRMWKRREWPEIKKNPKTSRPSRFHG
jgi:transposase